MEKIIADNEVSQCTSICQDHSIDNAKITVEKYLNAIVIEECFEFWKDYSKSTNLYENKLAEQALIYLSPPPTSTDVERLFSTAGYIITDERNRLLPQCRKNIILSRKLPQS